MKTLIVYCKTLKLEDWGKGREIEEEEENGGVDC